MWFRGQLDVIGTAAAAVLCVAAALAGAPTPVMAVIGLALAASPGYLWAAVLLGPRVAGLERVAAAAVIALMVPVLGGVALHAAGILLHRAAWTGLLAGVTLAGDVALVARRGAGRNKPAAVPPAPRRPRLRLPATRAASFGAAAVIAAGGVALASTGAALQRHPGFTGLWLASQHGNPQAADLGVSNHQGVTTRYRLVLVRSNRAAATWNLTLANGRTWQHVVSLTGTYAAADLYRLPDLIRPYRYVSTYDPAYDSRTPGS